MKRFLSAVMLGITICSCNTSTTTSNPSVAKDTTFCFLSAFNQDTVALQLRDSLGVLSGSLDYLPYEKDGTIGTLYNLQYKGDTLFGMYRATQEGQETVYEMAMLRKGNTIILTDDITGGSNYQFDSTYTHGKFIDKSKITFTGDTLKSYSCKQ